MGVVSPCSDVLKPMEKNNMTTEGNAPGHDTDLLRMDDEGPLPQARRSGGEEPSAGDDLTPVPADGVPTDE